MNSSRWGKSRRYVPLVLMTILSLLLPAPASGGSGAPFVEGVGAPSNAEAGIHYVLPCPGDVGVNTWNGNLVLPRTDLYLSARGLSLELLLLYNSQRRADGLSTYGPGWRMNYHVGYRIDPYNNNFIVTWGDGNSSVMPVIGDRLYPPLDTPELAASRYAPDRYRVRLFDGTTYVFDDPAHKRVTRIEDAAGNALTFTYDASHNLTRVANTAGGHFDFTYAAGQLASASDSAGRSVHYEYDPQGDLVRFVDAMGVPTDYVYSGHLLTGIVDAEGHPVHISYSAPSDLPSVRRVAQVDAPPLRREFGYTWAWPAPPARTTVTDTVGPEQRVTTYVYSDLGRLEQVVDARGQAQSYAWDAASNLISVSDRNAHALTYTYDARGNVLSFSDALGNVTRYTWHPLFNSPTGVTDPLGRTTRYNYDLHGNLIGIVDPQGNMTNLDYDAHGQLVRLTDARGHATTFEYDAAGNRVRFTNALGQSGRYEYDAAGNLTAVVAPDGARASLVYNAAGEATHTTDPLGHTRAVTYTDRGLVAAVTDEAGRTTAYGYDPRGRVTAVVDALGGLRQYTYDGFGYLSAVTDANGHSHGFGYDAAGRVITETDPLGRAVTYGYDGVGNVVTQTDAAGAVTTFAYDALDRHTATTYPDGGQVRLGHDAAGNVITATGPGFSYQYAYDENGHATGVADLVLGTAIGYSYDPNGNRRTMVDPDGGVTTYFYDALDRLERLVNPLGETTTWAYDARGQVVRVTYPNDTWTEMDYDALGRLTTLAHRRAGGAPSARYAYTYDAVGNCLSVTEDGYGTTTYTYDALNRLTQADGPDGTLAYTYDAAGNRLEMTATLTGTPEVTTYHYDAADRLLQSVSPAGVTDYQYDLRGNLIRRTAGSEVTAYAYDYANRLLQVVLPGGSTQQFSYDQSGLRRSRTDAGGSVDYVYDPLTRNLLLERQGGVTVARYTSGLEMDAWIARRQAGSSTFYHLDALGSVVALSDAAQDVVARYRYDPFGTPTSTWEDGSVDNPLRFSGRPWDADSGLYDLRLRVYDPSTARFLTPDPVMVPTLPDMHTHPYAYAGNNPLNRVDREGLAFNPIAWAEAGINMVSAGYDAWRRGGSLTDIVQAAGVSGAVDAVNALLGGVIPNAIRDPVKNLISQLIDVMRGKRCSINWHEFVRSIGTGLVKDIAGALFKAGAIGKDLYSKIIEQVHNGIQGVLVDALGPEAVPVAGSGPCHKRRQQPPVQQEAPRRQPPRRPTRPVITPSPTGDQGGGHGGGNTGTAQVGQLSPNPITPGVGQPLTHRYEFHNVSSEPKPIQLAVAYGHEMSEVLWSASIPPEDVLVVQEPGNTQLFVSFTGLPSNTVALTTTAFVSSTKPLFPPQRLVPVITGRIGDQPYPLDSPTEVGWGPHLTLAPGLEVRKFDAPDPVRAGAVQTYTLYVENTGGVALSNVTVTETYPLSVSYRSATPLPVPGTDDRWELGTLLPQEVRLITVTVQVDPDLLHNTLLVNSVWAWSDQIAARVVTETAHVRHHPPLLLTQSADPWPPRAGEALTFTLHYTNQGHVPITDLVAVESLDPRLAYLGATPAPDPGGQPVWSLGTLAPGAHGTLVLRVQVPAVLPYAGGLHNTAVFFGRQVDPVTVRLEGTEWRVYLPLVSRQQ